MMPVEESEKAKNYIINGLLCTFGFAPTADEVELVEVSGIDEHNKETVIEAIDGEFVPGALDLQIFDAVFKVRGRTYGYSAYHSYIEWMRSKMLNSEDDRGKLYLNNGAAAYHAQELYNIAKMLLL